jgi:hypothetical protein
MALGFSLSAGIGWHVGRSAGLMAGDVDHTRRAALISFLAAAGVFILSAAVALLDARWGRLTLLLMIPASHSRLWSWTDRTIR